jgi:hypothetical protein
MQGAVECCGPRHGSRELYGLYMSHLVPAVVITPGNCIEAPFTLSHEILFDGVVRVLREGLSAC